VRFIKTSENALSLNDRNRLESYEVLADFALNLIDTLDNII
jgi:hypothetical protein